MSEVSRWFTLGGNHVAHADGCCGANGLDDLRTAVAPRCCRIEQVGVCAIASNRDAVLIEESFEVVRVSIEAGERGESEFSAETGSVRVVCNVGMLEAEAGEML